MADLRHTEGMASDGEWVLPSLMILAFPVLHQIMLSLEPLCTLYTVPLSQTR